MPNGFPDRTLPVCPGLSGVNDIHYYSITSSGVGLLK